MREVICFSLLLCLVLPNSTAYSQDEDSTAYEEDFSLYADVELADGARRFATSKVLDQSPNKLISFGYDFQGSHTMSLGALGDASASDLKVQVVQGFRLGANLPVISKTNIIVSLGLDYWESHYQIDNAIIHPIANTLESKALRTTGISATIFKPFNETNFLLLQAVANLNGDYSLPDFQELNKTRLSGLAVYGWKKHDRLMYGFGFSRTYRIGEANYIPVFLYNYTFPSRKWGIEAVFPARTQVRKTFNARSLAFFGYELEGQSYHLSSIAGLGGINNPELRRSELRIRATFERSLKDFIWVSAQIGLRYNWSFNLDDGNISRGFGDDFYALENSLSDAFYFNISINLVSP
jgi:hypothetical protein